MKQTHGVHVGDLSDALPYTQDLNITKADIDTQALTEPYSTSPFT